MKLSQYFSIIALSLSLPLSSSGPVWSQAEQFVGTGSNVPFPCYDPDMKKLVVTWNEGVMPSLNNFSATYDGKNWSTPTQISSTGGGQANVILSAYNPKLGKLIATWSDQNNKANYSFYDGVSWSSPQLIPGGDDVLFPFPIYDPGIEKLVVLSSDFMTRTGASSSFDGTNWSKISIPGSTPCLLIFSSYDPSIERLIATWEFAPLSGMPGPIYSSLFDGTAWSSSATQITPNDVQFPAILTVFDPIRTQLIGLWADAAAPHQGYWSQFNGTSWSTPQLLPGSFVSNTIFPTFNPVIGKIVVTWADSSTNQGYSSTFDGTSWTTPEPIPGAKASAIVPAFDPAIGKMVAIWTDGISGNHYFSLFSIPPIPFSGTGNVAKVANYINEVSQSPTMQPIMALFSSLSPEQLTAAISSLSNARNAFMPWVAGDTALSLNQVIENRCAELREAVDPSAPLFDQATTLLAAKEIPQGSVKNTARKQECYAVWAEGLGNFSRQKAQDQNPAYHAATGGVILGADYYGEKIRVLGSAAYARSHVKQEQRAGESNIDSYVASLFGSGSIGNGYLELGVSGVYNRYHSSRQIVFPGFNQQAQANFSGWQVIPHLSFGYDLICGNWVIEPFGSAGCSIIFQDGFSEKGAFPLNMRQPSHTSELLQARGGLRAYFSTAHKWGLWFVRLSGAYLYKKGWGVGTIKNASIVDQPLGFTVVSLREAQNCFAPGLEFFVRANKGFFSSCSYNGEFAKQFVTNSVLLKVGVFF